MKKLIWASSFCLFVSISIFSQQAEKIDEFNDNFCDEAKARMDLVAIAFQNSPDSRIYMIYYTGKLYGSYIYDKKTKNHKKIYLYPRQNEAEMIIRRWINYLTRARGIPREAIVLINGGFREEHTLENWIVPKVAEPPKPIPTLTRKDLKFRKGKAKYVECEV